MSYFRSLANAAVGGSALNFTTYLYISRRPGQVTLEGRIQEICQTRVRYGHRPVHVLMRREGWRINQKKARRICRELARRS